ncbi:hypothetical protein ACJD0Z_06590 [Flavobacteriaceae bacterium M23B6Z8]
MKIILIVLAIVIAFYLWKYKRLMSGNRKNEQEISEIAEKFGLNPDMTISQKQINNVCKELKKKINNGEATKFQDMNDLKLNFINLSKLVDIRNKYDRIFSKEDKFNPFSLPEASREWDFSEVYFESL